MDVALRLRSWLPWQGIAVHRCTGVLQTRQIQTAFLSAGWRIGGQRRRIPMRAAIRHNAGDGLLGAEYRTQTRGLVLATDR